MAAMCIDLPDKIHERLRERAEADRRSMRKTIVVAVERFLDEETFLDNSAGIKRPPAKRGRNAT